MSIEIPLLRFGVLSDIQYANIDNASNFTGSELRYYRESVEHTKTLIKRWGALEVPPQFIAQLGDLIDGQNAGEYGQGLSLAAPQSEEALRYALEAWQDCQIPTYHSIGNHELYNFTWERIAEVFSADHLNALHHITDQTRKQFYFSWCPQPRWRMIMLCCYEENVIRPRLPEFGENAEKMLKMHNPNYSSHGSPEPYNFFAGLPTEKQRYVPFNGGLGLTQRNWLQAELKSVQQAGEQAIVMGHLPLYAQAASPRNIAFDADETLKILQDSGCVSVYFAGHRHGGGYAQDSSGLHHVTIQAPLTHRLSGALVDVYHDVIHVRGEGAHNTYTLKLNETRER